MRICCLALFLIVATFAFTESDYSTDEDIGSGFIQAVVELRSGNLDIDFEVTVQTSPGTATGMLDRTIIVKRR